LEIKRIQNLKSFISNLAPQPRTNTIDASLRQTAKSSLFCALGGSSSPGFDFSFKEDVFFAKYASLLFDFKVFIKFSKSSKLQKNGKKMKDEKMAQQDGFGSCP
jgi:hypothetical protein